MSHYITTHNAQALAIFSPDQPTTQHPIPLPGGMGSITILSSSHTIPMNLTNDADITQYAHDREQGLGPGRVCPERGVMVAILTFAPGSFSPMHRTLSFDTGVVLQGELELELDSGEVRRLGVGDSVQQRAVMHRWRNVTPGGGEAKFVGVGVAIEEPFVVGGVKLEDEWR